MSYHRDDDDDEEEVLGTRHTEVEMMFALFAWV